MTIHKILLNDKERLNYPAYHFGDDFPFRIEPFIFTMASELSSDYTGGYWHFYELSNGGFYMAPDEEKPFHVVSMNGYVGDFTPDVFGITVCLFAYSNLSFTDDEELADNCTEQFHLLREYMLEHPEVEKILRTID